MSANLSDVERTGNVVDERTLQLVFEVSMLGSDHISPTTTMAPGVGDDNLDVTLSADHVGFTSSIIEEARNEESRNMTECVRVPSSDHVGEIVGHRGYKIKALRAQTNTHIKTPVRGKEPVFLVTGRKEDVAKAKWLILSAAEHFSKIIASRKAKLGGLLGGLSPPGPSASHIPGQVTTIQVRVPYGMVGLVIGLGGATINRIVQETQTYIAAPSWNKEPVFEVSGFPENVQAARREIEACIAMRFAAGRQKTPEDKFGLFVSLYKTGLGSPFSCLDPAGNNSAITSDALNVFPPTSLTSSASSGAVSSSRSSPGHLVSSSIWNSSLERDEGSRHFGETEKEERHMPDKK